MISFQEFCKALRNNGYQTYGRYQGFMEACEMASIQDRDEAAMFLASLIYASDGLKYTKECDPKTINESKRIYGRYISRGFFPLKSIENYKAVSVDLGENYYDNPEKIEKEEHAWKVSCWFWQMYCKKYVSDGFTKLTDLVFKINPDSRPKIENVYTIVCKSFGIETKF
ncbi:chitinase 4-like [Brachionus plicatilis]|uniref:Chitinase 4-like n=1 Tax=Brachionus plicatilis TaxID=10195 RepID=A0A3M7RGU4_BRAPC|nr:chitinase 4-like [Brachionus plicatilis]